MSSIFSESNDIKSTKSLTSYLRDYYNEQMQNSMAYKASTNKFMPEEYKNISMLAINWPGDEIVGQIVKDTCRLMVKHNITPDDLI